MIEFEPESNAPAGVSFTEEEQGVITRVLKREQKRLKTAIFISLPICLLIGLSLFMSMPVNSIIVIAGGAISGLLLWAAAINLIPLGRGDWAYQLMIATDRTETENKLIGEAEQSGWIGENEHRF